MTLYAYLNFPRTCREAFTRYQEIFGGELTLLSMADMPPGGGYEVPAGDEQLVMHAALTFGDDLLMASDAADADLKVQGMYVNCSVATADEARRVWDALSEGGTIEMELQPTFWSPSFGVCTDRFGTPWMVSAEPADPMG